MEAHDLQAALFKIRSHNTSSVLHQQKPAQLLLAVEAGLNEVSNRGSEKITQSPTAYFASLLTTLDGVLLGNQPSLGDGETLTAILYLLALVINYVPQAVIQSHAYSVVTKLQPFFPMAKVSHPPSLRSLITIIGSVTSSVNQTQLHDIKEVKITFGLLVELTIDARPKVRKRAIEVVSNVLSTPPKPLLRHPWRESVAEWACNLLSRETSLAKEQRRFQEEKGAEMLIHLLFFLRSIVLEIPSQFVNQLTIMLLAIPRLSNLYLTQSSYMLLTALYSCELVDSSRSNPEQAALVLKALLNNLPSKTDIQLAPYWLNAVSQATICARDPEKSSGGDVETVWRITWPFLEGPLPIRKAAEDTLVQLSSVMPSDVLEAAGPTSVTGVIEKALRQIAFAPAIPSLLKIISALALSSIPDALHADNLLSFLPVVAEMRAKKGFEYKDDVDAMISSMMSAFGVEQVLLRLPLNLLPNDGSSKTDHEPRAYLLPLIPSRHRTDLQHFIKFFIPLSESLWELSNKSEKEGEKKVYQVLIEQIWNAFPSYCWVPRDLTHAFNTNFAERLTQILYSEPVLRLSILRGLKVVVQSHQALLTESSGGELGSPISPEKLQKNVEYLNTQAKSWLAVLFNVFSNVERESRGLVGEVISAWAGIANEPELAGAYRTILGHLRQEGKPPEQQAKVLSQMLDILILLVPFLPVSQLDEVLTVIFEVSLPKHPDTSVQKLAYRLLAKVLHARAQIVSLDNGVVAERIFKEIGTAADITSGAVKERLSLLAVSTAYLPTDSLHYIVVHLMEAVLGVKEHSEKARNAAFELLVVMGNKMKAGGIIQMNLIEGNSSALLTREANVEEFIKVVGASLAADRDHTISAGIMSISRVLFEFRAELSEEYQNEIVTTIFPLLKAKNREIVKSVLGFAKLTIHSLSPEVLTTNLQSLMEGLLVCLNEHKNHFKVKIRHILERLVRKYSIEEIEGYFDDGDGAKKMITNIRKRKERATRKKRAGINVADDGDDDDIDQGAGRTTGNAFEDVLYGSESELSESEDEQDKKSSKRAMIEIPNRQGQRGIQSSARLRMDDDDPMDLLEGTLGKISTTTGSKRRAPGQDASKFKTDQETGKILIEDDDEADNKNPSTVYKKQSFHEPGDELAGAAYKEALVSVDGFTRNSMGAVKFHKDTKKRRREEMEMDDGDVEMKDAALNKTKQSKHGSTRLGQEFKAKRAGGDVKRNGVDPYAYLSLGKASVGKRQRGKAKVSILGK